MAERADAAGKRGERKNERKRAERDRVQCPDCVTASQKVFGPSLTCLIRQVLALQHGDVIQGRQFIHEDCCMKTTYDHRKNNQYVG